MRRRITRLRFVLVLSLTLVWAFAGDTLAQIEQRENRVLEQWLQDRGLDGLLLDQLESRLESTNDLATREQLAKRLASLYGRKLLTLDGDSQALVKRTRDLIALYPQFESGRLRVAMLHSRYLESEKLFRDWIHEGAKPENKPQLETTLRSLDKDLSSALSALMRRSEELFSAGQLSRDQRSTDVQRQMVEAEALHCQFLAGWSRYFLAMLGGPDQSTMLGESKRSFREFLQLDQQTVMSQFDSKWFDFSSAWHVRAISGLAAISVASGKESQSLHLYNLIETNAVTRESREAAIRYRYLGHCYAGQFTNATNVVRDRKAIQAMSREGRVRLWMSVMDTLNAVNSKELEAMALAGLARNMAGEMLARESDRIDSLTSSEAFESNWIRGYFNFWKSGNGEPEAVEKASELLRKATSKGASASDQNDVARCRYLLAWLMLKQRDFQGAIGVFTQVSQQLADVDPQLASEAAWHAAKTSIQLGKRSSGGMNDAWSRLERFVRQWPDSPHANRASFEKLKIELRSMPPGDAVRRLQEISRSDENYGASLLEIATQKFRLWESKNNDLTMEALRKSCSEVQSSSSTVPLQKVRSNFLLVNALLRSEEDSNAEIETLLNRCESIQALSNEGAIANVELLYYQMQFGQKKGDREAVFASASRIIETGPETRFELPALIQLAKHHDTRLSLVSTSSLQRIEPAFAIYETLSTRLGHSADQLKSSANARVARSRLGELHLLAGRFAESEKIFQALTELFPGNANYLRQLAITKSKLDSDGAVPIWKRLAAGSEAGSDLWFESKFQLAKNLATRDRKAAVALLKQTMQLGGESSPDWQKTLQGAIEQWTGGEVQ